MEPPRTYRECGCELPPKANRLRGRAPGFQRRTLSSCRHPFGSRPLAPIPWLLSQFTTMQAIATPVDTNNALKCVESVPMTAFYYSPIFDCHVIERGDLLELCDF